jgi:hypothetical protein
MAASLMVKVVEDISQGMQNIIQKPQITFMRLKCIQYLYFFSIVRATQRVWDYVGDGYVHRLFQNKIDGKLVEMNSVSGEGNKFETDKTDHVVMEYTYLLSSQLESQREFYENQLSALQMDHSYQIATLKKLI